MNNNYYLLFKTGDSEFKAINATSLNHRKFFIPIVELTRGRKLRGKDLTPIQNRLNKVYKLFKGLPVCLDITSSERLSNPEILALYNPDNGYINWIDFLDNVTTESGFSKLVPCIIANYNDKNYLVNYSRQIEQLFSKYDKVAYRNALADEGCYDDIEIINQFINSQKLLFILDCGYVPSGAWVNFAEKAITRITNIHQILGDAVEFVMCGTSFPNNVSEIGKDDEDSFGLFEINLHQKVVSALPTIKIVYGDYGSINPIRNDNIVMARGWIPRIDVPTQREIFYKRERRGENNYSNTYSRVTRKIVRDSRFPKNFSYNWGIEQINNCAKGASPGSNPSFWISVRMNIHIQQQIERLNAKG